MNESLLLIEDLRVDYPGVVAVNGLSLTVSKGEICGLIGPNGAGKTTTMRAVVGIQERTRGRVVINGFDLDNEPEEAKKCIGFMPDSCPLYDSLTVTEFLEHFALAYDIPNRSKRIEECMEITNLSEKKDSLCGELSRGMRQRLFLCKTLLSDPVLLILDEPASGLDPIGRVELRRLLVSLQSQGKGVLISSHILTELSEFCTKVAIMELGKLVMYGTVSELSTKIARRRISVKWRNEDDKARQILLNAHPLNIEFIKHGAIFEFSGEQDDLDNILKTLVIEGVKVVEWRALGGDLEQIFLESGAKEVM